MPSKKRSAPITKKEESKPEMMDTQMPDVEETKTDVEETKTEVSVTAPVDTESEVTSVDSSKVKKEKKKRKTGTRTPSSYVLFSMEYRKEVGTEFPDLSLGEVSKKCGEKWKSMPEEEKAIWKSKADALKEEKKASVEPVIKKKRKPSSYLMFSMDYRKEVAKENPSLALGDVSRLCGAKWKSLSEEEKQLWKDKASA